MKKHRKSSIYIPNSQWNGKGIFPNNIKAYKELAKEREFQKKLALNKK